jgi:hypothetical protein
MSIGKTTWYEIIDIGLNKDYEDSSFRNHVVETNRDILDYIKNISPETPMIVLYHNGHKYGIITIDINRKLHVYISKHDDNEFHRHTYLIMKNFVNTFQPIVIKYSRRNWYTSMPMIELEIGALMSIDNLITVTQSTSSSLINGLRETREHRYKCTEDKLPELIKESNNNKNHVREYAERHYLNKSIDNHMILRRPIETTIEVMDDSFRNVKRTLTEYRDFDYVIIHIIVKKLRELFNYLFIGDYRGGAIESINWLLWLFIISIIVIIVAYIVYKYIIVDKFIIK